MMGREDVAISEKVTNKLISRRRRGEKGFLPLTLNFCCLDTFGNQFITRMARTLSLSLGILSSGRTSSNKLAIKRQKTPSPSSSLERNSRQGSSLLKYQEMGWSEHGLRERGSIGKRWTWKAKVEGERKMNRFPSQGVNICFTFSSS